MLRGNGQGNGMSALRVFQLRSTVCVLCVAAFVFAIKNKSATLDEGRALVVYRYVWRDDTSDTFDEPLRV